jgi:hypothetical protein
LVGCHPQGTIALELDDKERVDQTQVVGHHARPHGHELDLLLGERLIVVSEEHVRHRGADFESRPRIGDSMPVHGLSVGAAQLARRLRFGKQAVLEVVLHRRFAGAILELVQLLASRS